MPIKIENLSYIYSPGTPFEKRALDGITFTIEDGDFFGIVGHTGSGKSTLIGHFNALTRVQSGSITVDEFDLTKKKLDFKALRGRVGMVFQYPEYQLFDETVEKDVAFGPKNLGLKEEEALLRAKEAIIKVGLDYEEVRERSPFELSGGQKRRAALAGVLAMDPKILVLDEPTAGLDPAGKKEILSLLKSVKKSCPTIIMISHNMDEIAECCNRVAVLSGGKLEGVFTPAELFAEKEILAKTHLDLPSYARIAETLNKNGFDISGGILTEDELVKSILSELKGEAAAEAAEDGEKETRGGDEDA